jgi:hypothetical protein
VVDAVHFRVITAAEVIVKHVDRVYVSILLTVADIALFMLTKTPQTVPVLVVICCCQAVPVQDLQEHFVAACHHACVATVGAEYQAAALA